MRTTKHAAVTVAAAAAFALSPSAAAHAMLAPDDATPNPTATATPTSTATAAPTNPATGNTANAATVGQRSGLPFDSGVFAHDTARAEKYAQVVGRPVDVYQVAPERSGGWSSIHDLWWTQNLPDGAKLDVALPLLEDPTGTEWEKVGKEIAGASAPGAYVRPGWEFNLTGSWPWTTDSIGDAEFVKRFQAAATGIRKGCPSCLIEWNPNSGQGGVAKAQAAYPGDEYVDVIGIDAYDWNNEDPINGVGGLNEWAKFARDHDKFLSLPEWGTHGGADGRGDNPKFVEDVLAWAKENRGRLVMMSWFDETADYIESSVADGQMPKAGAALKAGFAKAAADLAAPVTPDPSTPAKESATTAPVATPDAPSGAPTTTASTPTEATASGPATEPSENATTGGDTPEPTSTDDGSDPTDEGTTEPAPATTTEPAAPTDTATTEPAGDAGDTTATATGEPGDDVTNGPADTAPAATTAPAVPTATAAPTTTAATAVPAPAPTDQTRWWTIIIGGPFKTVQDAITAAGFTPATTAAATN